jgi:hypothetical protein
MTVLLQILTHTPRWVFALFIVLLVLGVQQMAPREVGVRRVVTLPLAMGALSFYGLFTAFGGRPGALLAWALCAAATAAVVLARRLPAGLRFDAQRQVLAVPGSVVPLALMMGVFFTKYAVGVLLSQVPALALQPAFVLPCAMVYGLFGGAFAGRAIRLRRFVATAPVARHAPAI